MHPQDNSTTIQDAAPGPQGKASWMQLLRRCAFQGRFPGRELATLVPPVSTLRPVPGTAWSLRSLSFTHRLLQFPSSRIPIALVTAKRAR